MKVRVIELTFAAPVELTDQDMRDLQDCASYLCKRYERANPGRVMWPFGIGSRITYMPMTKEEEDAGLTTQFDDDVFSIECSERADYKWKCAKCGLPQGDHKDHILNPLAGSCDFEPAIASNPEGRG